MTTQAQIYVPIQGIEYSIIPEISLRSKNSFEIQRYAQENELIVLSSPDINKVARAVQAERPNEAFVKYARDRDHADLNNKDICDAYMQLHYGIKKYWIRAKEILMWILGESMTHPRLISHEIPYAEVVPTTEIISILLRDYKIVDDDRLDIRGISSDPRVRVNWPTRKGTIPEEMVQLLDTQHNTYVWTNPDVQFREGLRTLGWGFRNHVRPNLGSSKNPWDKYSYGGSLLGRMLESKQ